MSTLRNEEHIIVTLTVGLKIKACIYLLSTLSTDWIYPLRYVESESLAFYMLKQKSIFS